MKWSKKKYKMNLFDVYPLNNIEIVKASGSAVWDAEGQEYLDLYGGHAVFPAQWDPKLGIHVT